MACFSAGAINGGSWPNRLTSRIFDVNPFKLPWAIYLTGGLTVIALGVLIFFAMRDLDRRNAVALQHPAPARVAIEKFDPRKDVAAEHEINVVAQADMSHRIDLAETKDGDEKSHWTVIPLYAVGTKEPIEPAPGLLVADYEMTRVQLDRLTINQGVFGPILALDGVIGKDPTRNSRLRDVLGNKSLAAPNALIVAPFANGREAAFAATGPTLAATIISIGLMLIAYGVFRCWREPIEDAEYYA